MKLLVRVLIQWLPLAVAITGLCLLVQVAVQQNYRQSLNDPQVQMAEDGAAYLLKDYTPAAVVPRGSMIDADNSLAPWIAVYDASGKPLESDAVLAGAPPKPPTGVFDDAKNNRGKDTVAAGQNRISWQSPNGTRSAIVIQYFGGARPGYVVAGRNMREVENREGQLSAMVLFAWLTILITTFAAKVFAKYLS